MRSAATISFTKSSNATLRFHPRTLSALAGLPSKSLKDSIGHHVCNRIILVCTYSTSAGRKYLGSTLTTVLPDFLSIACSCSPLPNHLMWYSEIRESRKRVLPDLLELRANLPERLFCELSDRVHLTSSKDKVTRFRLLQHQPHSFNVITSCKERE